jgi:hypothetical protein
MAKAAQTVTTNNNYNNNNNNSYSLSTSDEEQTLTNELRSEVAGFASSSVEVTCSGVGNPASNTNIVIDKTLPVNWDYVKLDLFDNSKPEDLVKGKTKLKIALNIKKSGQVNWNSFNAQLNSPLRHMKRGLDSATWENEHYTIVKTNHRELKEIYSDVRASKFYEKGYKGKGVSVEELSVVVCPDDELGVYIVNLIFGEQQWAWRMRGDKGYLTSAQRKSGMIATIGIRKGNKVKNKNARDLL